MAAFYFRLCQSIKLYLSINRSVLPLIYVTILHHNELFLYIMCDKMHINLCFCPI